MKKNIIIFFFVTCFIYAQDISNSKIFSKQEIGLYGGINFENISGIGSIFILEGKTNITSRIDLKLSFGYEKVFDLTSYNVSTYEHLKINNTESYNAISYKIDKTEYKIIPFSVGLQYYFGDKNYFPYLITEASYNWIDSETTKSGYQLVKRFNNYSDLPKDYIMKNILPISSISLNVGVGIKYKLTSTYGLDFKYLFCLDNEIINLHKLIVGIFF